MLTSIWSGITIASDCLIKRAEKATKMWIWLTYLDLGAAHLLDLGGMKHLALEERIYLLGRDLVDVPEERIETVHDDGGTGTMSAVGAVVETVATGVQIEAEVVTGTAHTGTMTEITLDVLVDPLGAEAKGLVGVSPVMMS